MTEGDGTMLNDNNVGRVVDSEWEETTQSGSIFRVLRERAQREGKTVSIGNKNGLMETFHYGDEKAYLLKRLEGGTVGSDNGILTSSIEAYHYKRLPWWKDAVDRSQADVTLLDTPVAWAAKDGGVEDFEALFSPAKVMEAHQLVANTPAEKAALAVRIKKIIAVTVEPVVTQDFSVKDFIGGLRLIPKTEEAIKSRTEDNAVYMKTTRAIAGIAPLLQQQYQAMRPPTSG